jgi:hypothetical protein
MSDLKHLVDEIERLRAALNGRIEVATNLQMRNDELLAMLRDALRNRQGWEERADAAIVKAEGGK